MRLRIAGTILTLLAAGIAVAQPSGQPAGDPPSRVVRLNYLQGQVSFRPGSVDEWTNATLNYPIYNGDHLWADQGATAELHIGSTAIRLGSETALAVLNVDDRMVQISLTGGSLNVHIRALGEGESFEIDTPNSAVTLLRAGDYRLQVDEAAGVTNVTVHGGDTEINGGGRAFAVHARESATLTGIDESFSNVTSAERGYDQFDRWCQDRDRREEQSESARYVGREMTGYEDLDANGSWSEVPEYGRVWRPRVVAAGWAPYRYGHWAWVEPWGWTWVDDAAWGFAPFHYGRWANYRGGWVWVPGTMMARPVYAPALVAFVGGGGFSAAIAFGGGGGVAWFPLGPREVYRPAYRVSEVYVRQINVTHVNVTNINVTNVTYVNRTYVTAVPHDAFVGARPVHTSVVVVSPEVAMRAQVVGYAAPVAPERVSVMGRATVMGRVAAPPARFVDRTVVVRNAPPPPPVSFGAKQEALRANPGRPVDPQMNESLRRNDRFQRAPMVRSATPGSQPVQQQQPVRTYQPPARDTVQRQQEQQSQQPPVRNDRPNIRQQQQQQQPQQQQQQQQSGQPQTIVTRPSVQQQPNTQVPARVERHDAQPQQPNPTPRVERVQQPQVQQPQAQQPRGEPRQEVRQEQRKTERKTERKEEKKEEKKQ